ncbi:MAG: hypothetical protein PHX25_04000 [Candidatus Pacebacteria bacterium]|nr:hypothetical protein [Candidatus Paceibacterota bacterium]
MFKKTFVIPAMIGTFLFGLAVPAQAALNSSQINSIIQLLESFGADQSIINNVRVSLGGETVSVTPICEKVYLKYNLYLGVKDSETEGDVTKLQRFLANDPDIYSEALVTGFFGPMTEQAVKKWQSKQEIVSSGSPETTGYGVVGFQTRTKIQSICGISKPTVVSTIKVLSPNGGESLRAGESYIIRWESSNLPTSDVILYLIDKGGNVTLRLGNQPNTGTYSWSVPSDFVPAGTTGSFKIVVGSNDKGPSVEDQGDSYFNVIGGLVSENQVTIDQVVSKASDLNEVYTGGIAYITGKGFLSKNTAWFGDIPVSVSSSNGVDITLSVPFNLVGKYLFKITNDNGSSASRTITVSNLNTSESKIIVNEVVAKASDLNEVYSGKTAYIYGSGFLVENNTAWFGDIPVVVSSSNGKNIEFTVPSDLSPGKYNFKVTHANGQSDSSVVTVTKLNW